MERDHGRIRPWAPSHSFNLAGCFPWQPQRASSSSYTCGYCRREFRSAQALGGHMNVHRRDRARLRQCCSAYPSSLPSPNLTAHQHRALLPNLNFSPPHCATSTVAAEPVICSFFSTTTTMTSAAAAAAKTAFEVSLELGIGACSGGGVVEDDGLDLELRLGCAWERGTSV